MHYRNGREAKNGDKIVAFGVSDGFVKHFGELKGATPGNDYCNGYILQDGFGDINPSSPIACLCDCLHREDLAAILAEKGLDKRPAGK